MVSNIEKAHKIIYLLIKSAGYGCFVLSKFVVATNLPQEEGVGDSLASSYSVGKNPRTASKRHAACSQAGEIKQIPLHRQHTCRFQRF